MATLTSGAYRRATLAPWQWIFAGVLAGAVSVLVFHQGAIWLMNELGLTGRAAFQMQPTEPFGVPRLWSLTFWGAVWGAFFAAFLWRLDGMRLVAASTLLGAVLPTLVAWFAVAPLKGQSVAGEDAPTVMAFALIVNAAWGLGTGLGLALLGAIRRVERRRAADRRDRSERRRSPLQSPLVPL